MLNFLNSINRKKIKELPLFITLTYPDKFPEDPKRWKDDFNQRWCRRFERKYGKTPMIWRLELKDRKSGENVGKIAPHFHLMVFLDEEPEELYEWLSRSWYESCGKLDPKHLEAGTNVQRMKSWRQLTGYLAEYLAKPEQISDAYESPGRFWGKRHADLLPVEPVEEEMDFGTSIKVRRTLLKLTKRRCRASEPSRWGMTAYVGDGALVRLLGYWRYYRDLPRTPEPRHAPPDVRRTARAPATLDAVTLADTS
jgi:hypothetical protein